MPDRVHTLKICPPRSKTVALATAANVARNLFLLACLAGLAHARFAGAEIAGVQPKAACNYLTGIGLPTTTYRALADGSYRCGSPLIDIGTAPGRTGRMNTIAYAAVGDARSIATLQLTIDVDNPEQAPAVHRRLKDVAVALAGKLGAELPAPIQAAIAAGSAAKAAIGTRNVTVARTDRAAGAYEIKVMFE